MSLNLVSWFQNLDQRKTIPTSNLCHIEYFYWLCILFSRPFYCVIHSLTYSLIKKKRGLWNSLFAVICLSFQFSRLLHNKLCCFRRIFFNYTNRLPISHPFHLIHTFVEISHNVCIMYLYIKALFEQSHFEIHMSLPVQ